MGAEAHLDWQAAAASALAWWHEAGVDTLVDESARDWLSAPQPLAAEPAPAPIGALPTSLAAYLDWRHGAAAPEAGWPGDWMPAIGPAGATLMVLVDCPDRDDRDGLLSGAAGRLFDAMLAAIGMARPEIHVAGLCAKRPTAGRLPADLNQRLAEIALHHIGLVAPRRLLVMGNAASRAVLEMDVASARGRLHSLNHQEGMVIASFHPRFLLEKPAAKAAAWDDLQRLRRGLDR